MEIFESVGGKLQVTKDVTETTTTSYSLTFLKAQEAQILADLAAYTAARNAELTEVRKLITEAGKLGVK